MSELVFNYKVNLIIEFSDENDHLSVLRVLAVYPKNDTLVVIDIYKDNSWPFYLALSKFDTERIQIVSHEPYESLLLQNETAITPKRRQLRDRAWEIIYPIVYRKSVTLNPDLFDDKKRAKLIADREHELAATRPEIHVGAKYIRGFVRKFLVRGLHKNALLNGLNNCGHPGSERINFKEKPGPKSAIENREKGKGIALTQSIVSIFEKEIESGLKQKKDQEEIFNEILNKHFSVGKNSKGETRLLPSVMCPTIRQFRYYFGKLMDRDPSRYAVLKDGIIHYQKNYRPLIGLSTFLAGGPGYTYQGDATPLPWSLVSSLNRKWIIGSAYLYTVVDCFSEIIVGWYVGLRQNWESARMALLCAFLNKKDILNRYQLPEKLCDFPAEGICQRWVSDGAPEWTGKNSDSITEIGQGIELANPEAYRPDLKGMIESILGKIQTKLKHQPGFKQEKKERGEKDPRLGAALTIHESTQHLIREFALHNHHWIKKYPLSKEMIADELRPTSLNLWRWGIENISGTLSIFPEEYLRKTLLPRDDARIDGKGLLYKGLHYVSETALSSQMLVKARQKNTFQAKISYDPHDTSYVYYHLPGGALELCSLSPTDVSKNHLNWGEFCDFSLRYKAEELKEKHDHRGLSLNTHAEQKKVNDKAIKETKLASEGMSQTERISSIRKNRTREEQHEVAQTKRNKKQFDNSEPTSSPVRSPGYIPIPDYQDEIDQINNS